MSENTGKATSFHFLKPITKYTVEDWTKIVSMYDKKMEKLRGELKESIPISELEKLLKEYDRMTIKGLDREQLLVSRSNMYGMLYKDLQDLINEGREKDE